MKMSMELILGAIVTGTVAVIFIGSILAPQIATYTGTGQALKEYAGILGAVVVIAVVVVLMLFVRLITNGRD